MGCLGIFLVWRGWVDKLAQEGRICIPVHLFELFDLQELPGKGSHALDDSWDYTDLLNKKSVLAEVACKMDSLTMRFLDTIVCFLFHLFIQPLFIAASVSHGIKANWNTHVVPLFWSKMVK